MSRSIRGRILKSRLVLHISSFAARASHGGTILKSLPSGNNCTPSTTIVVPVM